MMPIIKLTVLFSNPFWIGIFEVEDGNEFQVCKVTFGSEPKDYEIYEFILKKLYSLNFTSSILIDDVKIIKKKKNPKRIMREIKKSTCEKGIGTKAQEALKLQYENNKELCKKKTKELRELDKERKYYLKQRKKLEKHKGH
ncbi:YjdF family protein [Clostridium sp. SHJSY1]|uniref:YjdF family protein n=1 Tax=Clostridium sp. SHJSY1 TaxID=2942483 RepID=UPI002874A85F|nr:YjdF family protein [Clostridium sp. SHJSY1]MDS0524600.1 YjdF family protein [Clostridium sp. SHJSY1]